MKDYRENSIPVNPAASLDHIKPCWYWDKKDLAHTPSQSEGLDPATEARYRREGARFIFDVGTRLGLHYDTLATGIIYFHRFYMFHSFKQFPRYVTGGCCLFLAGKVEETPKKCKDIIKTARSLLNDIQFAQFGDDPKEEVMVLERILLQTIKFDLQVEHPYQFLLRYAKQLKGDKNKVQKLVQMAWTFVNDSLCTMLSLQWEPEIIAVAVMYLAGRLCKFDIQEWTSKQSSRRWWEQFVQDVPVELLEDICHQILDLYSQGKQQMPQGAVAVGDREKTLPSSSSTPTPQQLQLLALAQASANPSPAPPPPPPPPPLAKKASPQASPPRQIKRAHPSPQEEKTSEQVSSKIPRLEAPMPPLPTTQPPPDRKALASHPAAPLPGETDAHGEPAEAPKALAPPPPHSASHHQPPPLPHRPPPPPPSSYIMGIPTSSSYMSGEGYQSLQSLMKTEGPSYAVPVPPSYGPPPGYHGHVYPPSAPPPPAGSYPPPSLPPPPSPAYPPPGYNHSYPPPRMPPGLPGMGMPSSSYPGGQSQGPPPLPPGMPPMGGMSRGAWMM
ncbi:cyclin-K-like [Osmerus mordax]|uniref:cyclin-K-like n=1 Tax=Osmerus mordax TaxID=8014 RepID=UPI00350F9549